MTASEYVVKEYNIVQVTKKSPLKAPKTTSILQTPPANKVCKGTRMPAVLFFFCIKRNRSRTSALLLTAIMWEAGTTKKKLFLDERKENEYISGEIG